jgi:hypothetical protein
LTRRAKHRQNDIIETSLVHPRGAIRRGFFRLGSQSDGGRIMATHSHTRSADRRAAVRTPFIGRARANVPARGASNVRRAAAVSGYEIGFAPETIAHRLAICRAVIFMEKR